MLSQCINHPIHTVPDHEFATRCCAGILTSAAAAAAAAAVVAVAVAAFLLLLVYLGSLTKVACV